MKIKHLTHIPSFQSGVLKQKQALSHNPFHRPLIMHIETVLSRAIDLHNKPCSAIQSQPGVNAHFHFRVKEAAAVIVFPDMWHTGG